MVIIVIMVMVRMTVIECLLCVSYASKNTS